MQKTVSKRQKVKSWVDDATILSSYSGMDSTRWDLGILESLNDTNLQNEVSNLASVSTAPNPFFEIPILSAANTHLSSDMGSCIFLSRTLGQKQELKLFAPVKLVRLGLGRNPTIRFWSHDYAPLGQPLMEDDPDGEILHALIECLSSARHETFRALLIDHLPRRGKFLEGIYQSPRLADRLRLFSPSHRAGLGSLAGQSYSASLLSGKRKQRLRKARERLSALGEVRFELSRTMPDIKTHLEEFLELEASGWKGERSTALSSSKDTLEFTRAAIGGMAQIDRCEIHSMHLDSKAVSSLITFEANGFYFPWKIAFDESYADYSVGNLLMVHATELLTRRDGFRGLDSLASESNMTANRFWPDRLEMCSVIISLSGEHGKHSTELANQIEMVRRAKKSLKRLLF